MELFVDILRVGGHTNSLGRSGGVLEAVRSDTERLDELFKCISADDAWVRMRAIDTFEKIIKDQPELVQPYLESIFDDLIKSEQPSVQWHLAQIFGEVMLSDNNRSRAIEWLEQRISTVETDWIVSVNVMKTLLNFYKIGYVTAGELNPLFRAQTNHSSKSVRKKATLFLQELTSDKENN